MKKKFLTMPQGALLRVLLVAAAIVLLNIISIRIFGRIDLTRDKIFTLAPATIEMLRSLDDPVTIRAYVTEELPPPYNNHRRSIIDLLNEYDAYGGAYIVLEFISPKGEKQEQEAQAEGIPPVEMQVVREDKLEALRGYMGLVFLYEDKKESLPVVQNLSTMEYDVSSIIKRLTTREKQVVGYTVENGEFPLEAWHAAADQIRQQYELLPVQLASEDGIPPQVSALLIPGPTIPFTDEAKKRIDDFVLRGGKIAFLINEMNIGGQNPMAAQVPHGLNAMLASYGAQVNQDLVRDVQCGLRPVMTEEWGFRMQTLVPFPWVPKASNFSESSVMVTNLETIYLGLVSSVDTVRVAELGLKADFFIRSSTMAARESGTFIIDPSQRYTERDFDEKNIPLALVVEGRFTSAFDVSKKGEQESRIVVMGDADWILNELTANKDNLVLASNLVDFLADETGLISTRSRSISQPLLDPVTDATRSSVKTLLVILPPSLVIGFGLWRWSRRRSARRVLEQTLS